MAHVVDAECQFETRRGEAARAGQAGVVDQQMQRQATRQERICALAHRGEVAQVQRQRFHLLIATGGTDCVQRRLGAGGAAAGKKHMCTAPRQFSRRDQADPGIGARDQGNTARDVGCEGVGHGGGSCKEMVKNQTVRR
jgi:hypothetical protein